MPYKDWNKRCEYQKKWTAIRRRIFFADRECEFCGSNEGLEIDHIIPKSKSKRPKFSFNWSLNRIMDEFINHCRILCHRCHVERHASEMRKEIVHGTLSGYKKGCRCDKCSEVCRRKSKEYRLRKKTMLSQVA